MKMPGTPDAPMGGIDPAILYDLVEHMTNCLSPAQHSHLSSALTWLQNLSCGDNIIICEVGHGSSISLNRFININYRQDCPIVQDS